MGGRSALEYLLPLKSDIYALQEVNEETARAITERLNETYKDRRYAFQWRQRKTTSQKDGCATVYDTRLLEALSNVTCSYNQDPEHIFMAIMFRCAGTATTKKTDFWLINTHVDWKTRNAQLKELIEEHLVCDDTDKSVLGAYASLPKLVMGDFNAEASHHWYPLLKKHQVEDVCWEMHRVHPPFSFNNGKSEPKFIDFILLQGMPFAKVASMHFLGNNPDKSYKYDVATALPSATVPSDHLPVTFDFWPGDAQK
jgi:endonuclease/exonuclease/phosphatase family metal-dependent hydrolase